MTIVKSLTEFYVNEDIDFAVRLKNKNSIPALKRLYRHATKREIILSVGNDTLKSSS